MVVCSFCNHSFQYSGVLSTLSFGSQVFYLLNDNSNSWVQFIEHAVNMYKLPSGKQMTILLLLLLLFYDFNVPIHR